MWKSIRLKEYTSNKKKKKQKAEFSDIKIFMFGELRFSFFKRDVHGKGRVHKHKKRRFWLMLRYWIKRLRAMGLFLKRLYLDILTVILYVRVILRYLNSNTIYTPELKFISYIPSICLITYVIGEVKELPMVGCFY